jgi:chromosomal replication initiation ATPase DnaA
MRNTPAPSGGSLTLTEIGEATGGYDHTTVLYGLKAKERRDAADDSTDQRNL